MPSILDRIQRGDQSQAINPWTKSLIYADPGAGKTVFAATAPKPLFLDTENSTEVLDDWPELKKECVVLPIERTDDFHEIIAMLMAKNKDPLIADRQTIVVDTISEGHMANLSEVLKDAVESDDRGLRSPWIAFQNDYKEAGEHQRRILVALRALPMHLIVTAHRIEDKATDGRIFVRPDLPPRLAQTSKGIMGLQAYLTYEIDSKTDQFKNTMFTRQTKRAEAKTRYRYIPSEIEMPTFADILAAKQKGIDMGIDEENTVTIHTSEGDTNE